MTETFVSMIAMIVALLVAFGTAIVITAALIAWQDWQRRRRTAKPAGIIDWTGPTRLMACSRVGREQDGSCREPPVKASPQPRAGAS